MAVQHEPFMAQLKTVQLTNRWLLTGAELHLYIFIKPFDWEIRLTEWFSTLWPDLLQKNCRNMRSIFFAIFKQFFAHTDASAWRARFYCLNFPWAVQITPLSTRDPVPLSPHRRPDPRWLSSTGPIAVNYLRDHHVWGRKFAFGEALGLTSPYQLIYLGNSSVRPGNYVS